LEAKDAIKVNFNTCVMGAKEDGSAPVIEGEKERRPSGTDSPE
jgi:hypothetical protein